MHSQKIILVLATSGVALCSPRQFSKRWYITPTFIDIIHSAAADVDQDGVVDLVLGSRGGRALQWSRGLGGGSFEAPVTIFQDQAFERPGHVLPRDFDGDGDIDIVCVTTGALGVTFHRNLGGAIFDAPVTIGTESGDPSFGDEAYDFDADADGDLDVLTFADDGTIVWYENVGSAQFGPMNTIDASAPLTTVTRAADYDGDGLVDIVASWRDSTIGWYRSLGMGQFAARQTLHVNPGGQPSFSTTPALQGLCDFDRDGDLDLFGNLPEFGLRENLGNGMLGPTQVIDHFPAMQAFARDLNGDGREDFVLPNGQVNYSLNQGGFSFSQLQFVPNVGLSEAHDMVDVDNDGDLDLLGDSSAANIFRFIENQLPSNGTLIKRELSRDMRLSHGVAVGDLDLDGRNDVITTGDTGSDHEFLVLHHRADGRFDAELADIVGVQSTEINWTTLADVDGDGHLDAVMVIRRSASVAEVIWIRNHGSGFDPNPTLLATVRPHAPLNVFYLHMDEIAFVRVTDVDLDGVLDLLYVDALPTRVMLRRGLGSGAFDAAVVVSSMAVPLNAIEVSDLNGDSFPDLVVAGTVYPTPSLLVAHLNASGTFGPPLSIPNVNVIRDVDVADIDADGLQDLAITGRAPSAGVNSTWWLRQTSNLNFATIALSGTYPRTTIEAVDVDSDGNLDLVTGGGDSIDSLRVHFGLGSGLFADPVVVSTAFGGLIAIADIDGDSDLDFITTAGQVLGIIEGLREAGRVGLMSCVPTSPNSTGASSLLEAYGTEQISYNAIELRASRMPQNSFALCLASRHLGFVPNPGGSQGTLCLSGAIGRAVGGIQSTGASGTAVMSVDLSALPQPTGAVSAVAGAIWHFQCWHRDVGPIGPTSNLTNAVSLTFR